MERMGIGRNSPALLVSYIFHRPAYVGELFTPENESVGA
jgi:hypothetical protein